MSSYLKQLESEAIDIFRKASGLKKQGILFSGGKDSAVLMQIALRAFWPAQPKMSLIHIDTGHNFPEVLRFRDEQAAKYGFDLQVFKVEDSIKKGSAIDTPGESRNRLQSVTLLEAINELELDAVYGGGRRDEEKARAKERVFSLRQNQGGWKPESQSPELWSLYNTNKNDDEHYRIFPLSNWTEKDIWDYIQFRNIEISELYYSHEREVIRRGESYIPKSSFDKIQNHESYERLRVRFRTIGDISCSTAIASRAENSQEVISELLEMRTTERGSRLDDQISESAMEDRKKEGYF